MLGIVCVTCAGRPYRRRTDSKLYYRYDVKHALTSQIVLKALLPGDFLKVVVVGAASRDVIVVLPWLIVVLPWLHTVRPAVGPRLQSWRSPSNFSDGLGIMNERRIAG